MSPPIRGKYEESAEHLAMLLKQMPRSHANTWILIFVGTASVVMAYLLYLTKDKGWFIFLFMLPIFFVVMAANNSKWSLRRKYRTATGLDRCSVICEFDANGFRLNSNSGVKTEFGWSAVTRVIEKEAGLLIYAPSKNIHWIPKSA